MSREEAEETTAEPLRAQLQPERVRLNSWDSNSYSDGEQHRGTRRCGSR
ncbi:hypothetical protein ACKI2C_05055 [Streptomyces brasiliscabiei]